jgi:hypothetical protein
MNFNAPFGIALDPAGAFAYITSTIDATVYFCPISPTGEFGPGPCNLTGTFIVPSGITITKLGVSNLAYVATQVAPGGVTLCQIQADGSFGVCTPQVTGPLSRPGAIALNATKTFAYIASLDGNTVFVCPVSGNGTLGACSTTGSGFTTPIGIAIR